MAIVVRWTLTLLLGSAAAGCAQRAGGDDEVVCRLEYEDKILTTRARAAASAYDDAPLRMEPDFLFRIVYQRAPPEHAAIRLYTYADTPDGPALIHQARFPYPLAPERAAGPGFTGMQTVYQPRTQAELQYWCALNAAPVRPP